MPVRNTAKYLRACLDSIVDQSYTNWELIAINNQSTDESRAILGDYSAADARIRIWDNTNSDLISALRLSFSHSSGALITRMDSDDKMTSNRLKIMSGLLISSGKGFICTGKVHYFSEEAELGGGFARYEQWLNQLSESNSNFSQIYKECVIPSPCWMVWRSDLIQCGAFDPDVYPEDYDLCFRFYEKQLQVIASNEVMLEWRDYSTRNSRTDPNYADQLFFDLKLDYFFKIDVDSTKKLAVWGAGRKGKILVQKLKKHTSDLSWVTDSPTKIGHNIYDLIVQDPNSLTANHQVLIAVSNDEEQKIILERLRKLGASYYVFC